MIKRGHMKHQILLYLSAGLIIFFALLNIRMPSPTGAAADVTHAEEEAYAVDLNSIVKGFFGDISIDFPDGGCGDIAKELYGNIAYTPLDVSSGYGTTGPDRIATMNFVIDRTTKYGTLDMAKGSDVINDGLTDSFISINTETIVRVPKEIRTTFFAMDLYGTSDGDFIVMHGSFSTPSVDCKFVAKDGIAICNCASHPITGIRIAGIAVPRNSYHVP